MNLPFFSTESFWALMMKAAKAPVRSAGEAKEKSTGGLGGWCMLIVVVAGAQGTSHRKIDHSPC